METKRLKDEVERYQIKLKDMIQENSKKIHEEKMMVERKYRQELDHLNNEMSQEIDTLTRTRLDLERQKRIELDLRREIQQKSASIEDMRQEMQIKFSKFRVLFCGNLQKII